MKITNEGVFLKIFLRRKEITSLPITILNPTNTGADYMVLGNEDPITHVEKITGSLSDYCFDYILIYIDE